MLVGPFYVDNIAPDLRGVVPYSNRTLLGGVPVHFYLEGSSRAMDSDLESSRPRAFGFYEEFAFKVSQQSILQTRTCRGRDAFYSVTAFTS